MPLGGDTSLDMATSRELAGATTFVPQGVSEAYRDDVYDPKSIVTPPSAMAADDEDEDDEEESEEKEASVNIETLKEYFANPTDNLRKMIGNKKYSGTIDNKHDLEICSLAADLESVMGQIIDEDLSGLVLMDKPEVIDSTIETVLKYQESLTDKPIKMSLDERFYQLSKILVESGA